jgi:hypothetical protein
MNTEGLKLVGGVAVDKDTEMEVRIEPIRIEGRGWTVGRVTGSIAKGWTLLKIEQGHENCVYTFDKAQFMAWVLNGYLLKKLSREASCK